MRRLYSTMLFMLAWLCALAGAAAQTPANSPPGDTTQIEDPEAPRLNPLETAVAGIVVSGYAEASYSYSTAEAQDDIIVGRSFERLDDQFMLNVFKLVLEKPVTPDELDAGFRVDLLVGKNATLLQSLGLNVGDHGDIEQAYAQLSVPVGNGLVFKAGKWVTLLGVEVIEDVLNPTWSEGNQFLFAENFTGTGLEVSYRWNDRVDTQFRVYNGWDVVEDNNDGKSFMGRVGIAPDERTTIGILGFIGPEQPDDDEADRKGVELVTYRKLTDRLALWTQLDYGREDRNPVLPDPTRDAEWWAAGLWATYDFTPELGVGLRADYFNDMDGARTSGAPFTAPFPANTGHEFGSATLTLNVRAWENMLVRPEIRYDKSSLEDAFGDDDEQATFSLSAAYLY